PRCRLPGYAGRPFHKGALRHPVARSAKSAARARLDGEAVHVALRARSEAFDPSIHWRAKRRFRSTQAPRSRPDVQLAVRHSEIDLDRPKREWFRPASR